MESLGGRRAEGLPLAWDKFSARRRTLSLAKNESKNASSSDYLNVLTAGRVSFRRRLYIASTYFCVCSNAFLPRLSSFLTSSTYALRNGDSSRVAAVPRRYKFSFVATNTCRLKSGPLKTQSRLFSWEELISLFLALHQCSTCTTLRPVRLSTYDF